MEGGFFPNNYDQVVPGSWRFLEVPDSLDDFNPVWCGVVLRKCGAVNGAATVSKVTVEKLQNEETGFSDGGGFSSAKIIRIHLTYNGQTTGYEPDTLVAKTVITGELMIKLGLLRRLMLCMFLGRNFEEKFLRKDIKFYREAIPLVPKSYSYPKLYYTGMMDGGNRGFFKEIIRSMPHKIRTVTLMQDMNGWETKVVGVHSVDLEESIAVLQNVAVLHGSFWGTKNEEIKNSFDIAMSENETRPSSYNMFSKISRNGFLISAQSIRKTLNKALKHWESSCMFAVPIGSPIPSWLTVQSDQDDSPIFIFKDPNVIEMLEAVAMRYPDFNTIAARPFMLLPSQTLLHGDFHSGNHMYLKDESGVKVVAFDFQGAGVGLAVSDIIRFLNCSRPHTQLSEDFLILKRYHEALVQSGVNDYNFDDLKIHFVIGCFEVVLSGIINGAQMTLETSEKWMKAMTGEKWPDFKKILDSGIWCNGYLFLTSLYLHDKENFLRDTSFITNA